MEKLKVESLVSAELMVSNADTENRERNISAVVRMDNGAVSNITRGQVLPRNDDGTGSLASFESFGAGTLNVQFQTRDSRAEILSEIEAFVGACRTDRELTTTAVNS